MRKNSISGNRTPIANNTKQIESTFTSGTDQYYDNVQSSDSKKAASPSPMI